MDKLIAEFLHKSRADSVSRQELAPLAAAIRVALGNRLLPHPFSCPCRELFYVQGGYGWMAAPEFIAAVGAELQSHGSRAAPASSASAVNVELAPWAAGSKASAPAPSAPPLPPPAASGNAPLSPSASAGSPGQPAAALLHAQRGRTGVTAASPSSSWERFVDDTTGVPYYHNTATDESR
jgi:hypothetical protein